MNELSNSENRKTGRPRIIKKLFPFLLCVQKSWVMISLNFIRESAIFWESVYRKIPGKHSNISRHQSNDKMQMP